MAPVLIKFSGVSCLTVGETLLTREAETGSELEFCSASVSRLAQLAEVHSTSAEPLTPAVFQVRAADFTPETYVNYTALLFKARPHVAQLLDIRIQPTQPRVKMWRKYSRYRIDKEHGSTESLHSFLAKQQADTDKRLFTPTESGFEFKHNHRQLLPLFASACQLAAALRWCVRWTPEIKLTSEANWTRRTFDAVTVKLDNVKVIRREKEEEDEEEEI